MIMDPPYPEAGQLCLTAEELADDWRVEEAGSVPWGVLYDAAEGLAGEERVVAGADDPFGAVDDYLREHPEINGGRGSVGVTGGARSSSDSSATRKPTRRRCCSSEPSV